MAILNVSSYITSAGLQAVTSAGAIGPYFAIKYFVPFYDVRIDSSISLGHSAFTSAMNISALNLTSATASTLAGEKIFASSAANYSLSNADYFYNQVGMNTISDGANGTLNTKQESQARVNLLSGKPLSYVVSAASVAPTSTIGAYTLTNSYNVSGTRLASFNPISATPYPTSAFFRVQSYSPKAVGSTSAVGTYKCRIPSGTGSFKFNGMALFATKVDHHGFDVVNTSPVLFAVVLFDKPQIKSSVVGGVNSFEVDVDLGFDWNSISGGTSNTPIYVETNYWTKVPTTSNTSAYALNYDGDIVISSSAAPGSWMPKNKLTVVDPEKAQLRLSFDGGTFDRYTDITTKRRRFDNTGAIGKWNDTTDIGVLSIDTACATDSLLEIGTNVVSLTPKSIVMGVNVSATNCKGSHNQDPTYKNNSYNFAFATNALVYGHQNTLFGGMGYVNGRNNFVCAKNFNVGNEYDTIAIDESRGYNFAFGNGLSINVLPNNPSQDGVDSDYYSDGDNVDTIRGGNIVFGKNVVVRGGLTFTHGMNLNTSAIGGVNFGSKNINGGPFSFVQGQYNKSTSHCATIFGYKNEMVNYNEFAFIQGANNVVKNGNPYSNTDTYSNDTIFGTNNTIENGLHNFVKGHENEVKNLRHSLVFGYKNNSNSDDTSSYTNPGFSFNFGYNNSSSNIGSFVFGRENTNKASWAVAIGRENLIEKAGSESFSLGNKNILSAWNAYSIGSNNKISKNQSIAIGYLNNISGSYSNSFAIGTLNVVQKSNSFAIGNDNNTDGEYSFTIGNNLGNDFAHSIVIGDTAVATMDKQVYIGGDNVKNITLKADEIKFIGDMAEDPYYCYTFNTSQKFYETGGSRDNMKFGISVQRGYGYNTKSNYVEVIATTDTSLGSTSTDCFILNPSSFANHTIYVYIDRTSLLMIVSNTQLTENSSLSDVTDNKFSKNINDYHRLIHASLNTFSMPQGVQDSFTMYEINNKTVGLDIQMTLISHGKNANQLARDVTFKTETLQTFPINVTGTFANDTKSKNNPIINLNNENLLSGGTDQSGGNKTLSNHYVGSKFFLSSTH
jgi:hypothetical protein